MSELYEIEITGTIGPLIQSCLPEFSAVAETPWTVLCGTVRDHDDLRRVLDLLHAHGTPALDIRITPTPTGPQPPRSANAPVRKAGRRLPSPAAAGSDSRR